MCNCNKYRDDKLHHECGVLGIYGVEDAAGLAYYGLHALQHRGQQGCGIVTVGPNGDFHRVKGDGLVTEVFNESKMALLPGKMAIGHVRYSNAGCRELRIFSHSFSAIVPETSLLPTTVRL